MRMRLTWDLAADDDDAEIGSDDVAYYQAGIKQDDDTPPADITDFYMVRNHHAGQHCTFKIEDGDESSTFYGWVRSVSPEGEVSDWYAATEAGNSDPAGTPDGVADEGFDYGEIDGGEHDTWP